MGQNLGKFWSINWSYFGPNMGNICCWANYGQNMDHKLVIKWEKFDHEKVLAKIGQKLGKTWYIKWAKYGQDLDKIGNNVLCVGWCVVLLGVFVTNAGQNMV